MLLGWGDDAGYRLLVKCFRGRLEPWALKGQELELELIQPHMAQKPVLRGEVECACVARQALMGPALSAKPIMTARLSP